MSSTLSPDTILYIFDMLLQVKQHINKIKYYEKTPLEATYTNQEEELGCAITKDWPFSILIRLEGTTNEYDSQSEGLWYPTVLNHPSILPKELQFFHKESQLSIIWLCENFTARNQKAFDCIQRDSQIMTLLSFLNADMVPSCEKQIGGPPISLAQACGQDNSIASDIKNRNPYTYLLEEISVESMVEALRANYQKYYIGFTKSDSSTQTFINLLDSYLVLNEKRELTHNAPKAVNMPNEVNLTKKKLKKI